jgi:hypothetical protein
MAKTALSYHTQHGGVAQIPAAPLAVTFTGPIGEAAQGGDLRQRQPQMEQQVPRPLDALQSV